MNYTFPVTRTTNPKPRPEDETKLGFAKYFTDHMFVMDYDEGQGWHDGRVVPHAPFLIEARFLRAALCPDDVRRHEGIPLPGRLHSALPGPT